MTLHNRFQSHDVTTPKFAILIQAIERILRYSQILLKARIQQKTQPAPQLPPRRKANFIVGKSFGIVKKSNRGFHIASSKNLSERPFDLRQAFIYTFSMHKRRTTTLAGAVKTPAVRDGNVSAWAQYSVLHPRRHDVVQKLRAAGIPTAIYYPIPLHLQEAFACLGYRKGDFPVAEKIAGEIFSLPMPPYLKTADQERICAIIAAGA